MKELPGWRHGFRLASEMNGKEIPAVAVFLFLLLAGIFCAEREDGNERLVKLRNNFPCRTCYNGYKDKTPA